MEGRIESSHFICGPISRYSYALLSRAITQLVKNARNYAVLDMSDLDLSAVCDKVPTSDEANFVLGAAYDSAINYTDEQIGRVVEALREAGLLDSTLVVVAGDHGEELGEHGEYGHRFRFMKNVPCTHHVSYAVYQRKEN